MRVDGKRETRGKSSPGADPLGAGMAACLFSRSTQATGAYPGGSRIAMGLLPPPLQNLAFNFPKALGCRTIESDQPEPRIPEPRASSHLHSSRFFYLDGAASLHKEQGSVDAVGDGLLQ